MRRKSNHLMVLALAAVLVLPAGCKKEETPPPPPPAPQKPAPAAKQPVQQQATSAKLPAVAAPQLDFTKWKDPFKPFVEPKVEKAPAPRAGTAGLLPIQSYSVEQFRVSGIIVGLKESKALIIDPAGKGYVVKQGMAIGINNGVITRITPSFIEVAERYRDDTGRMTKRTVKLSLPKKQ